MTRLVRVLHERLIEEARLGEVLLEPPGDDLLDDLRRLAGLDRLVPRDLLLVAQDLRRNLVAADETGRRGRDVHRDVAQRARPPRARPRGSHSASTSTPIFAPVWM